MPRGAGGVYLAIHGDNVEEHDPKICYMYNMRMQEII